MSTPKAELVSQRLVDHVSSLQGSGASPADLVEGYRLAADRVASWGSHGHWPTLRDNKRPVTGAERGA